MIMLVGYNCQSVHTGTNIFQQLKGDEVIQDLERKYCWTAEVLNAGLSASHLFTITTGNNHIYLDLILIS